MNKNNFKMLKFLNKEFSKNKSAQSLTTLVLSGNNLKSIKFLVKTKFNQMIFSNLKHLDLSRNNLGDENIKYIEKFNCINLEKLYLYTNMFTDYTIFNMINEKFKNLEEFYIGFNRFEKNSNEINEDITFEKLKRIGLNYVFNEYNYKNLGKFKLENLEQLYIQHNGISNLDIIEKMKLFKIKELYLINNEFDEIDVNFLIQFPYLERIYLDNSVSRIINFDKIQALTNFKYFDFDNIKIDIEIIKEKGPNFIKDLEIILN